MVLGPGQPVLGLGKPVLGLGKPVMMLDRLAARAAQARRPCSVVVVVVFVESRCGLGRDGEIKGVVVDPVHEGLDVIMARSLQLASLFVSAVAPFFHGDTPELRWPVERLAPVALKEESTVFRPLGRTGRMDFLSETGEWSRSQRCTAA